MARIKSTRNKIMKYKLKEGKTLTKEDLIDTFWTELTHDKNTFLQELSFKWGFGWYGKPVLQHIDSKALFFSSNYLCYSYLERGNKKLMNFDDWFEEDKEELNRAGKPYVRPKEVRDNISESKFGKHDKTKRQSHYYRKLVENFIGRELTKDEVIHHRDNNPLNNSIENLQVMNKKEHQLLHKKEQEYHNIKLNKEDCLFIVEHTEINYKELAEMFDISPSYVYEVRRKFKEGRLVWQIL